jgi:methyltransferase (TIGR00027 family)
MTQLQNEIPLKNISDTAFWVATYRAMESERPDALFKDPYAELLSGQHGRSIVQKLGKAAKDSWFLVARTCILDAWILKLIEAEKIDAVLNLAAGLDTRAYRLKLPSHLRWYDVDLPDILTYKESRLKDHHPTCGFEFVKQDLSDVSARKALFAKVNQSATKTLVISEGFLMYLNPTIAASLAEDLSQFPTFKFWLAEMLGPAQLKWIKIKWGEVLEKANAVMNFAPAEGADFFIPYGWKPLEFKPSLLEAIRIQRAPRIFQILNLVRPCLPKSLAERFTSAGIALLKNTHQQ